MPSINPAKKIKYVYVAGPLTPKGFKSANPAIEYLYNLSDIVKPQIEIIQAGLTPFPTGLDFIYFLLLQSGQRITEQVIKRVSKDWLRRSDAILMIPGWKNSPGSIAEKKLAEDLGLPVFYSLKDILEYNAGLDQPQLPLTN